MILILCITLMLFSWRSEGAGTDFAVNVNSDGSYSIVVQGNTWLKSAPTFFRADGKIFTTADGSLKLVKNIQSSGQDFIGQWESNTFIFQAGSSQIEVSFVKYTPDPSIFTYNNPPVPFMLFKQKYMNGANNTANSSPDFTISGFPGFVIEESSVPLGYLSYGGRQLGSLGLSVGQWGPATFNIDDGLDGGPLALFDNVKTANTLILSSASEFMSSSIWRQKVSTGGNNVYWGTMGGVEMVPSMFESSYILFCGNQGINKAFVSWGEILQTWYGRTDQFVKSDFTINYLGYWTDNGAYYYGRSEPGKSMQDTILDVVDDFRSLDIPIRYIQYDGWWYYKEKLGIINWDAPPNIFPNGVRWLYNKTNVPVLGYSATWSSKNVYAKQNGGSYNFVMDGEKALPTEERFWTDLLSAGRQWGLIAFEQDFLNEQFETISQLKTDVHLGKMWMKQMGLGAAKNGLTVQYCMTLPRQVLQSLEIPVVTQSRASHDYHPSQDNWKIGVTSLFAWAVGIAPYKDNFWTNADEPGSGYGNATELYAALNAVVSTLSTGPVGISDMVGAMNKTLVMRSANADGLILKPSRPATAIDNWIRKMAWPDFEGPNGEVWSTYSDFGGNNKYGIVLAAGLNGSYTMTPCMAGYQGFPNSLVFPANDPNKIQPLTDPQPLTMSGCTMADFCLFYVSPVIKLNGKQILIQGELAKWVPMSPQRVTDISIGDDIIISLTGAANEVVVFWFNMDGQSSSVVCTLGTGGLATLTFNDRKCYGE